MYTLNCSKSTINIHNITNVSMGNLISLKAREDRFYCNGNTRERKGKAKANIDWRYCTFLEMVATAMDPVLCKQVSNLN